MSEDKGGDITNQIRILSPDATPPVAPAPVDNLNIQVAPELAPRPRLQKEMPVPENTTFLGEANDNKFEPVFVDEGVLRQMSEHLTSNLAIELGGGLAGNFFEDPNTGRKFTIISGFVPDIHGVGNVGTFRFTADSWANILRQIEGGGKNEELIGWVRSHPFNYPPAPSGHDEFIMRHFFDKPEQVTLILGRGGEFDKKYALWRWEENSSQEQAGMGITGGTEGSIRNNFGYYTLPRGEAPNKEIEIKISELKENWFRRSIKGIFSWFKMKFGKETTAKIDQTLSITPDELVDDVAELITILKDDEAALQNKLDEVSIIIGEGREGDNLLEQIQIIPNAQPSAHITITEQDLK